MLKNEKNMIILYVKDQHISKSFYQRLLNISPILDVPGMTEFKLSDGLFLGLMPEDGIYSILGDKVPHPKTGNGIPRCELYLFIDDISQSYSNLVDYGGNQISPGEVRPWGDIVAYGSDPDGHIIALAKTNR